MTNEQKLIRELRLLKSACEALFDSEFIQALQTVEHGPGGTTAEEAALRFMHVRYKTATEACASAEKVIRESTA